jgi:hypothetical protein
MIALEIDKVNLTIGLFAFEKVFSFLVFCSSFIYLFMNLDGALASSFV